MWVWKRSSGLSQRRGSHTKKIGRLLAGFLAAVMTLLAGCGGQGQAMLEGGDQGELPIGIPEKETDPFLRQMGPGYVTVNQLELNRNHTEEVRDGCRYGQTSLTVDGLKNQDVEKKINDRIEEIMEELSSMVPPPYRGIRAVVGEDEKPDEIAVYVYEGWNYDNLLSLNFYKSMWYGRDTDTQWRWIEDGRTALFDLNTGEELTLSQLSAPGADGVELVNGLMRERIEETMGAEDSSWDLDEMPELVLPFQGIGENQSFALDAYGLRIVLDYQNPEFDCGFGQKSMRIGFKDLEGILDLTVGLQGSEGLYESEEEPDRMLLYQSSQKDVSLLLGLEEQRQDTVYQGRLTVEYPAEVPAAILKKMEAMQVYDEEAMRKKLREKGQSQFYYIFEELYLRQLGNYYQLSHLVSEVDEESNQSKKEELTYDCRTGRQIELKDLFREGYDYRAVLTAQIEEILKERAQWDTEYEPSRSPEEICENLGFYLDATGILFFDDPSDGQGEAEAQFHLSFRELGYENLALFEM